MKISIAYFSALRTSNAQKIVAMEKGASSLEIFARGFSMKYVFINLFAVNNSGASGSE